MSKNDQGRIRPGDIAEALTLLTRLPVATPAIRGAKAAWAYPLAGGLVALIAGLAAWAVSAIGLPGGLAGVLVLGILIMLTGAMHEDGLADCADGFWGGNDVTRRLEIMKDSRIGTYGVVALILSLLARWAAIVALINAGWLIAPLISAAMLSRVPMVGVMCWLDPARKRGLSTHVGRPDHENVILAFVIAMLVALVLIGFAALPGAIVAGLTGYGVARLARAKINGQTGDVLGATQQIAEISVLAVLATLAS